MTLQFKSLFLASLTESKDIEQLSLCLYSSVKDINACLDFKRTVC